MRRWSRMSPACNLFIVYLSILKPHSGSLEARCNSCFLYLWLAGMGQWGSVHADNLLPTKRCLKKLESNSKTHTNWNFAWNFIRTGMLGFSLGLPMLTRMYQVALFLSFPSQPSYLVQRGNASFKALGCCHLPSGNLVRQEEPNTRKKRKEDGYLYY